MSTASGRRVATLCNALARIQVRHHKFLDPYGHLTADGAKELTIPWEDIDIDIDMKASAEVLGSGAGGTAFLGKYVAAGRVGSGWTHGSASCRLSTPSSLLHQAKHDVFRWLCLEKVPW